MSFCNAASAEQLLALGGAGLRHVAHGGSCVAYYNYMLRLLDTQRTIIVLAIIWPFQAHASGRIRSRKSCSADRQGIARQHFVVPT